MPSLDDILGPESPLEHFTNRREQLALVRSRLMAPAGTSLPMVMFFGVGGTGKSHLFARIRHLISEETALPTAYLDFNRSGGANLLADNIPEALFAVSQQLNVVCPRFELAFLRDRKSVV